MSFTLRAKRLLVGAASGALVLSLLPAGIAAADTEAVCNNAPDADFSDVNANGTHTDNINCMTAYGIGIGLGDGTYGVYNNLTRGQAATLLVDFAVTASDGAISEQIDETRVVPFTDIQGTTHEENIEVLYKLRLIEGTTATTYSPNLPITRVQFATILFNAHEALGTEFDASYNNPFTDTTRDEAIALAGEGIISGTTTTTFEPFANVLRGQTATLLAESAGVLDDAGNWLAPRLEAPAGPSNQTFTVTPADAQNTETNTVTQFSASGITSDTVDIALLSCDNVTTDSNGVVTFEGSNPGGSGNVAVDDDVAAEITVVNGTVFTPVAGDGETTEYVVDADSADGTTTFTVDNNAAECYVAVVFDDADNDGNLDLNADGTPSEAFGVAGAVNVLPAEGLDNTDPSGTVTYVDKDADLFVADGITYYYDSNDEFILDADSNDPIVTDDEALTIAEFEERLTVGDVIVDGNYRSSPANQSSFTLDDVAPAAPAISTASNTDEGGVTVTLTNNTDDLVDEYRIYRADAIPGITPNPSTCSTDADDYAAIADIANDVDEDVETHDDTSAVAGEEYCYGASSIDGTDEGPINLEGTFVTAGEASTQSAPVFTGAAVEGNQNTVVVTYDEPVQCGSVDTDASNYAVSIDEGTSETGVTETAAECVTPTTVGGVSQDDQVVITTTTTFADGDVVIVRAQNGDDGNTVLDLDDVAQPVGDAVQASSTDTTAPTATDATFTDDPDATITATNVFGDEVGDLITVTYDEDVVLGGTATIVVDATEYIDGTNVTFSVAGNVLTVTVSGAGAADTTITDGTTAVTGTTNVDDAAGNAAGGYPEIINDGT